MKLTPAKCPCCGANLEVNEALKNTICQYCGTTVLIEETIEKYNIELSGKVEVEGIKTDSKKIENAKKHMAIGEYIKAQDLLNEVNADDSFNVESQALWIKNAILLEGFKVDYFEKNFAREDCNGKCNALELIIKHFDRLVKIDEAKEYEKTLGDELQTIYYLKEVYEELVADEKELKEKYDKIWYDTSFNTMLIIVSSQLNLNKSAMQWLERETELLPNKDWTTMLTYRCIGLKITRNGGVRLKYKSIRYDYLKIYYYQPQNGPYTKQETIEKMDRMLELLKDQEVMKNIDKQLIEMDKKWYEVDLNFKPKKGFLSILGLRKK